MDLIVYTSFSFLEHKNEIWPFAICLNVSPLNTIKKYIHTLRSLAILLAMTFFSTPHELVQYHLYTSELILEPLLVKLIWISTFTLFVAKL